MEAPSLPPDAPRVSEGRYVLLTRLGEGGMAVVYGAWDQDLRIWRAVKVLLPEYARKASVRRRFEREAETMMAVRHKNLVRVLEVNARRALPYMVMDLVGGGSLQEWALRHGAMPPRLAVEVGLQVCAGLAAAHAAGIVHRDVKPQNVLVDLDGTCKLTDFGVARVDGGDTKTGVSMGTVGYMAPEQLNDSKSVDERSDVYGLGATLFVLASRRSVRDLFRAGSDDAHVFEGVPAPLTRVLTRCLRYEREERYADMEALATALRGALPALPALPDALPPLPRAPKDAVGPGVPAGEFTELQGMMDTHTTFTDEEGGEAADGPSIDPKLTPLQILREDETAPPTARPKTETPAPPAERQVGLRTAVLAAVAASLLTGLLVAAGAMIAMAMGWLAP